MHTLNQLKSGELKGITRLKISAQLSVFPEEIFLLADTLEILDLSGNQLSELPDNFSVLTKLKIAFFSDNNFTTFPEILSQCPDLEMIGFKANKINYIPETALNPNIKWLILTNNHITSIPQSIGKCQKLRKLMLAGNHISHLPAEFSNCIELELVRLSANQFIEFPTQVFELPKLAWLAFAGNPFSNVGLDFENQNQPAAIPWHELEIGQTLGEGASGIISKAVLKATNKEVAVKIFKGEVTSDGLPSDEMKACIAAGNHENKVSIVGNIVNHPENKQGLVMELIPSDYINLGNPPSFERCTRDTFSPTTQFSVPQILNIATGISSAVADLHHKGIMHGDLYAHNILINENGNPLFGDFGAAMIYDKNDSLASKFEKLESRAFGYLLDDLLPLTPNLEYEYEETTAKLNQLRNECLALEIDKRPDFDTIFKRLKDLY